MPFTPATEAAFVIGFRCFVRPLRNMIVSRCAWPKPQQAQPPQADSFSYRSRAAILGRSSFALENSSYCKPRSISGWPQSYIRLDWCTSFRACSANRIVSQEIGAPQLAAGTESRKKGTESQWQRKNMNLLG